MRSGGGVHCPGELVNRTNQINRTTIRYPRSELAELVSWSDTELRFENAVLSCHAMAFELEKQLVLGLLADRPGASVAIGRYLPTERNNPSAALSSSQGFQPSEQYE